MNIAFPALFVFLLALPGIVLRYSYREWAWKIPVYRLPIGEEVAKGVFAATVLNLGWCLLAQRFGYQIVFRDVLILLTGGFGLPADLLAERLSEITRHPGAVAAYFISLYLAAAALGLTGRWIVRGRRLDLRYKILRFDNFWHYALNAELALFSENRAEYAERFGLSEKELMTAEIFVVVSGVTHHGQRSFVYFGLPIDYFFDREGKLDKIVVTNATYEELWSPREVETARQAAALTPAARPVDNLRGSIEADIFVLSATDLHNIGIEYICLATTPPAVSTSPDANELAGPGK